MGSNDVNARLPAASASSSLAATIRRMLAYAALQDEADADLLARFIQSSDDAAGALGLSKSGLKKRMERGRELLRTRLVRRGLAPALPSLAPRPVSATLTATTAALATGFTAGTIPATAVPTGVLFLFQQGV